MGKKSKVQATQPANTVPTSTVVYSVVAPKRPLTGTKFGQSGNAYTHGKLVEAAQANGGTLTWAQVQATCAAAAHKGFAAYALNRLRILVAVQQ